MKPDDARHRARARSLCADIHDDDGPPERRRKEAPYDASTDRKTLQLCAQVRRALLAVIPPAFPSPLESLIVERVAPDPDATRLRVFVSVPHDCPHPVSVLDLCLRESLGRARAAVAEHIHRKHIPTIAFQLIPRETEQ